jgi:hypothetical protein
MSTYEAAARERKAGHLAEVLRQAGCTSEDALGLSESGWERATELANTAFGSNHDLPSRETKALVIQNLENIERLAELRSPDPFAGMPRANA